MRKKTLAKSIKLKKNQITPDEVLIQSALIMVRTIADSERGGATVKFQTEVKGDNYNIDVVIEKQKEKLYLRIWKSIKLLFDFASKEDNVGISKPIFDKTTTPPKMKKV